MVLTEETLDIVFVVDSLGVVVPTLISRIVTIITEDVFAILVDEVRISVV